MTEYNYVFYSLRDEQVLAEIPLIGTNFEQKLNSPGQGTGTFQFDQTGRRNEDLTGATTPGRTAVAVERNGVVVWTGIVWSRTYQSQSKTCQMFFWGFEAYPNRQRILTDFTGFGHPANIFLSLWRDMGTVAGRNFNINIPADIAGLTGSTIVEIKATDYKYYGEIMHDLSDAKESGFDWTIDVTRPAGTSQYVKTLRVGVPFLGATTTSGNLVFEYPGSILNYYETESMASAGTHIVVLGSGEGSAMIVGTSSLDGMVDSGFPRWDFDISRKDVVSQDIVDGIAEQQGIVHKPPMQVVKANVKGNLDPVFGSYALGDNCTLVIVDSKHSGDNIIQLPTRLIGWELSPASSENTEEVSLMFAMELEVGG